MKTMSKTKHTRRSGLWAASVAGLKQNLLPGVVIQLLAASLLACYWYFPQLRSGLIWLEELKLWGGFFYAGVATAVFGGLVPWLYLIWSGRIAGSQRWPQLWFYLLFWMVKGMEVDGLYRLQDWWFGSGRDVQTIVVKVLVDQFVYNPLWAGPTGALFFRWKELGFDSRRLVGELDISFISFTVPTVLLSTWLIWIPAVAIIYCMPLPLQVPLFNIVLCFFVLLLAFVTGNQAKARFDRHEAPSVE